MKPLTVRQAVWLLLSLKQLQMTVNLSVKERAECARLWDMLVKVAKSQDMSGRRKR